MEGSLSKAGTSASHDSYTPHVPVDRQTSYIIHIISITCIIHIIHLSYIRYVIHIRSNRSIISDK